MSSILTTPTTASQAATIVTVTATVTVVPEPGPYVPPNYSDHFFGVLSDVNGVLFVASVLVALILGFNRMVAIPMLATLAGILSNGLGYYCWILTDRTIARRIAACMVADVCWQIQDVIVAFYSFFMLEKMLTGFQRRLFMSLFLSLFVVVAGMRFTNTAMHALVILNSDGYHEEASYNWGTLNYKVTRAYWGVLAGLEVISAGFLLRVFYSAQREAVYVGPSQSRSHNLFSRLAHSSEIRVATLAGVGVTRAVCFGFYDNRYHFDRVAYVFANTFAVLLLIDLLVTRLTKFQNQCTTDSSTLANRGGSNQNGTNGTSGTRNTLGSTSGKGPIETLQRDFPGYVGAGKGWDHEDGITKMPEVNEEIARTDIHS